MGVVATVVVVVVAAVCVCVLPCPSLIDRAREATRDRATHSNDCARSAAGRVVAAAVVVACVAVARVYVRARVCVFSVSHFF